jgi:hypothetical protein
VKHAVIKKNEVIAWADTAAEARAYAKEHGGKVLSERAKRKATPPGRADKPDKPARQNPGKPSSPGAGDFKVTVMSGGKIAWRGNVSQWAQTAPAAHARKVKSLAPGSSVVVGDFKVHRDKAKDASVRRMPRK